MKRIETCTTSIALSCAMLAFAFVGCTSSDGPTTGGIEANITLTEFEDTEQTINEVTVTISCDGDDPLIPGPGPDWPTETFPVNVSTSEGNNPLDPKPTVGIFKKEGLPPGLCRVQINATSSDGTTRCDGHMDDIPVAAGPNNTFRTIIVNCTSNARYGGIGINGEFNRCAEFEQVVVSPTTQTTGNNVDIDIWCNDLDGDPMLADVRLVTKTSFLANPDPTTWVSCDNSIPNGAPGPDPLGPFGGPVNCDNVTPLNLQVTCDASGQYPDTTDPLYAPPYPNATTGFDPNNPWTYANCIATVAISDDFFASAGNNLEDGCLGYNYVNAFVTVPVFCAGSTICGNGLVEPGEGCDPDGFGVSPGLPTPDPTDPGAGTWCGSNCQKFDPCDAGPCPAPADPCQAASCNSVGDPVVCTDVNSAIPLDGDCGTACTNPGINGCSCQGAGVRTCQDTPLCVVDGDCTGVLTTCRTAETCVSGACVSTVIPGSDGTTCAASSICISGDCILDGQCVTTSGGTPLGANSTNLEAICPSAFNAFDPNYWNTANADCGTNCQGIGGCVSNCLQGIPSTIFPYAAWDPNVNLGCASCSADIQVCIATSCVWRLSDGVTNCAQGDADCTASGPCAPPNDPFGIPCQACQSTNGCDTAFLTCGGDSAGACTALFTPPN